MFPVASFAERLRELREEANLKQEDIAKKLNISTSAYGYYEQGRNEPSLDALQTLSVLFDTTTDYLIGTSDKKNSPELIKVTGDLTLSSQEIQLMIELKKYPRFVEDLITNPEKKVAKLYKFWSFIQNEMEE
ncbi:XRE family transcriptional regulator [Sporolactobacillus sp. THM7-7]|nr:XRE family transcriptional regulator [Sporolactobacillus sp. THM7-7]